MNKRKKWNKYDEAQSSRSSFPFGFQSALSTFSNAELSDELIREKRESVYRRCENQIYKICWPKCPTGIKNKPPFDKDQEKDGTTSKRSQSEWSWAWISTIH